MSMVINTNMGAINAQRILDGTSREQSISMERLTSGLRINKAADDAAGLAVVTGMTTQSMGTEQAIRNANDGIGLLQTVDGASEEVVNMLQRMRELGLQSMNGTYNSSNRVQMQAEFSQLQTEIQRVADTTKFNGMNVMNANDFSAITANSVQSVAGVGFSIANSGLKLQVGWETASANQMKVVLMNFSTLSAINAGMRLMSGTSISFSAAVSVAKSAIAAIDNSLSSIKTMRAAWGALQNRLDYTISNLSNVNENIQGSRSRIQDADFAKESANLARTQVLQQAGMSMLSQSNSNSQNVLSLLR